MQLQEPFCNIASLSELYFRFRRFTVLVETKKVIYMNYGSQTSCWKPWRWVRLDLILSMRDAYINFNLNPLTKSLLIYLSNPFVTLPRVPITTGMISIILSLHNLPTSLQVLVLLHFFLLFFLLLHQLIQQYQLLFPFTLSCQLQLYLVFLPLSCCHFEHRYPTTLSSLLLLRHVHATFLCILTHSSYKGPYKLSLLHCHIVSYILPEPISHTNLLSIAHFHLFPHIICTGGFYWSYWYGASVCHNGLLLCNT